ncbi:MAG: AmmeMemoRadiSam system protein B [Planctomycetota bacterium]
MPIPPLRPLDTFPFEESNGQKRVGIRDPLGVVEGILWVSPEAFLIAAHFDGQRDAKELADIISVAAGQRVSAAIIEKVFDIFSKRGLLMDAVFHKAFENLREEFARTPARAAAHAGSNYPEEPDEFRIRVGGILAEAWDQPRDGGELLGLIAPHIDLERGMLTYAQAYGAMREIGKVDRFVILGTSHGPVSSLIVPTRKDYNTPLGPARTDRAAVDRVAVALGENAYDDEFAHKNEHSIEFQTIFLKLIHPNAEIVPLLCGSLRSIIEDHHSPAGVPEVERAVEAVRAALDDDKKTVIVAGADLAHVGPHFGGPKLSEELLKHTEKGDRDALDFAAARDAEGWYRSVASGGDPRNTCGLSPIYFLLRLLDRGQGQLLSYRRCESPEQCVTISAMSFVDSPLAP